MVILGVPDWLYPVSGALLGLIFGSFLATLTIRWPLGQSVLAGRSRCDHCQQPLTASELIPLLSHWRQRGRCRHCDAPIARDHLLIELGCAFVAALLLWLAPQPATFALVAASWLLLTLATLDVQHFWLPDRLILLLALCAVPLILLDSGPNWSDRLIGGAAGFGSLWLVGWLFQRVRGVEGLGGGDPKLFGAIGLLIGWQPLPLCMVLACLLALLSIGYGWWRGRAVPTMLPLGSFLAMATYLMLLLQVSGTSADFG